MSTHVWYADCSESLPDVAASPRNARKKRQISQAKVSANTARQSGGCFNFRRSICFHSPHSHDGDLGPPQLVEQRRHVFQVAVRYVAAGEPPATDSSRKSVYFKGCIRNQLPPCNSFIKEGGWLFTCMCSVAPISENRGRFVGEGLFCCSEHKIINSSMRIALRAAIRKIPPSRGFT